MTNRVLLNNIDHKDLTIALPAHGSFDDGVNHVVLFPTELEAAQRDYPILLRRDDQGQAFAVALLGLDPGENLFVDDHGWSSRYVPALLQRGPFSIGVPDRDDQGRYQGEPMIHVDLDDPRVAATGGSGEPVFREHGGNAPYLDHMATVLRTIFVGAEIKPAFFAALDAEELIEPVTLEISIDDTRRYDLPDFHTIGQERLRSLDAAALDRLHRADFLRPAIWIASSLGNIGRLVDLKNRRRAQGG